MQMRYDYKQNETGTMCKIFRKDTPTKAIAIVPDVYTATKIVTALNEAGVDILAPSPGAAAAVGGAFDHQEFIIR